MNSLVCNHFALYPHAFNLYCTLSALCSKCNSKYFVANLQSAACHCASQALIISADNYVFYNWLSHATDISGCLENLYALSCLESYIPFYMPCIPLYIESAASSPTGVLHFGPSDSGVLKLVIDTLAKQKVPHEVLDAEDVNRHFGTLNVAANNVCVMEEDAGTLRASVAVQTLQVCGCSASGVSKVCNTLIIRI